MTRFILPDVPYFLSEITKMQDPGSDTQALYTMENGKIQLEIRLSSPGEILNPFSPVPFNEQGLTSEVEEYIVETVRDFPANAPFRIVLRMPSSISDSPECQALPEVIRHHFRYEMLVLDRRYRQWIRFGKKSLVIGLLVLALATFLSRAILQFGETLPVMMIADGATICGWVAMWAPATVLLAELWPIRETRRIYEKIVGTEIVIVPSP
jgi:hypothetical protein